MGGCCPIGAYDLPDAGHLASLSNLRVVLAEII
jgi:hypothetical protein